MEFIFGLEELLKKNLTLVEVEYYKLYANIYKYLFFYKISKNFQ